MVDPHIESEILRLHHAEKWRIGTIVSELGVHHDIVERVLSSEGAERRIEGRF